MIRRQTCHRPTVTIALRLIVVAGCSGSDSGGAVPAPSSLPSVDIQDLDLTAVPPARCATRMSSG